MSKPSKGATTRLVNGLEGTRRPTDDKRGIHLPNTDRLSTEAATSGKRSGSDRGGTTSLGAQAAADAELASLRRTRLLLERQLEQMDATNEELADSDSVLRSLGVDLDDCEGEADRGKHLLRSMVQIDTWDDRLVLAAWTLFFTVLAHVWADRLLGISFFAFSPA